MATINCDVYRHSIKIGSGTIDTAAFAVAAYTSIAPVPNNRRVILAMQGGNSPGATMRTRVVTDGGSSLTLADACPFS